MKLEDNYPTDRGTGSGTQTGYSVEARSPKGPAQVGEMLLSEQWQKIAFPRGERGVPAPGGFDASGQLCTHGLYSYASAQALRWWLHAAAESDSEDVTDGFSRLRSRLRWAAGCGIETRLVKHEVKYQYSITAVSAEAVVEDSFGPPKEPADCATGSE